MPTGFSVSWRNTGDWDVCSAFERAFAIRTVSAGFVYVRDERKHDSRPFPRNPHIFRSLTAAIAWCADELMAETEGGNSYV